MSLYRRSVVTRSAHNDKFSGQHPDPTPLLHQTSSSSPLLSSSSSTITAQNSYPSSKLLHLQNLSSNHKPKFRFNPIQPNPTTAPPGIMTTSHLCTCKGLRSGPWICCDSPSCPIEWYHCSCVGVPSQAQVLVSRSWICPRCRAHAGARTDDADAGSKSSQQRPQKGKQEPTRRSSRILEEKKKTPAPLLKARKSEPVIIYESTEFDVFENVVAKSRAAALKEAAAAKEKKASRQEAEMVAQQQQHQPEQDKVLLQKEKEAAAAKEKTARREMAQQQNDQQQRPSGQEEEMEEEQESVQSLVRRMRAKVMQSSASRLDQDGKAKGKAATRSREGNGKGKAKPAARSYGDKTVRRTQRKDVKDANEQITRELEEHTQRESGGGAKQS